MPTASQIVINEIPVEIYIALRWTVSGGLFAVYGFSVERWKLRFTREGAAVGLLGVGGYALASLGSLYGLKFGGVANFALIGAFGPVITTLLAVLILKERPSKFFYFALGIAVFGLILLVNGKSQISSLRVALLSSLLIVGGAILESLVFIYSKQKQKRFSTAKYLAIAQLSAAGFMWLAEISIFHQFAELGRLSAEGWSAVIFVSLVACVLCYAILYWLLRFIDGHRLALFDGLHVLSASAVGAHFFHEPLNVQTLTGAFFLLVALALGNLQGRKSAPSKITH